MMNVGLHVRISGRLGRDVAAERFRKYAKSKPKVWIPPGRHRKVVDGTLPAIDCGSIKLSSELDGSKALV